MKAMIFAAGIGTRLRPLTDNCPKALIPVGGHPMLKIVIEQLKHYGFDEIILNVHYLGEQIKDFLRKQNNFGIRIEISDETNEILETGGGLWKAREFFDDGKPFLVCNADVFTNIDLQKFYKQHNENNSIATLAVRKRYSSRFLLFDDRDILCGWKNVKTDEVKLPRIPRKQTHQFAFSGYHIISPEIFKTNNREGQFSMVDWYLDICNDHMIKAFHHDDDVWIDIGSAEELAKANEIMGMSNE
jgi:NDP-sugar pyrophosphorylase family protein